MRIISHRGNLNGPTSRENEPKYICEALDKGFEVEVDLWMSNGKFFFGHDFLQYEVGLPFLLQQGLWIHCKNLAALEYLSHHRGVISFGHKQDDFILTSKGHILLPPQMGYHKNCITMMPELNKAAKMVDDCAGVITDFAATY